MKRLSTTRRRSQRLAQMSAKEAVPRGVDEHDICQLCQCPLSPIMVAVPLFVWEGDTLPNHGARRSIFKLFSIILLASLLLASVSPGRVLAARAQQAATEVQPVAPAITSATELGATTVGAAGASVSSVAVTTTTVDSVGSVGYYPSVAINSSGLPVISYFDATNSDLKLAVCENATCTSNILTTVDSAGSVGGYTSLVLNGDGFPVLSYYDYTNGDLKLALCGNATCTSGNTLTTVDAAEDVGRYTSLALNSAGFPVISYIDASNYALKLAVCGNAACTAGNTLTTVDDPGTAWWFTSLVLDGSGFPVIRYQAPSYNNLKLAVCEDVTCSSKILTVVDSTGMGGSLALNSDGLPVISYSGGASGSLELAVCGNATCTSGNTITTVDTPGGGYSSVALDSSGFPIISYKGDNTLELAVCGDAICSSGNTLYTLDTGVGEYLSMALTSSGSPVVASWDYTNLDLKLAIVDSNPPVTAGPLCYVDGDATTGADTGQDWDDAYTDLQSALTQPNCTEIWVAEGTYKPTTYVDDSSREVSFNILPAVQVYGGFAGDEGSREERDPAAHITTLSGDIGTPASASDNSYHVVYMDGTAGTTITGTTLLDGFSITKGNASGPDSKDLGGGLYCNGSEATHDCSPALSNLTFSGNMGAALCADGHNSGTSSPSLTNVDIQRQ